MIADVADTHTALGDLLRNSLFIDTAASTGNDILLSPIRLAEIIYLTGKNRLPLSAYEKLKMAMNAHPPERVKLASRSLTPCLQTIDL